ncbi:MAG: hypothetical protein KGM91_27970, partial [Burkholderiales bacterium]|nr:hypothetical protein [Burkholderiales bacterium]
MLELLAGPFNLREPNGTAVTVSSGSGNALYDDTVGMMSTSSVFSGTVVQQCVTQIDGVSYARASTPNATAFVLDLTTPADWLAIDTLLADKLYAFDRLTAVRGALILSGSTGAFNGCQARCADRFLYIVDGNVQFRPPDLSAGATTEATLTGHGSGTPSVSRTNQATVLCLAYPSGEIIFYDFVAKTQPPGSAYIGA